MKNGLDTWCMQWLSGHIALAGKLLELALLLLLAFEVEGLSRLA